MSNSVSKAFQIVDFVADRQGLDRQVDITKALDMKKATAHRYFEILEELHILEKKDNTYYLGMELLKLGSKVQSNKLIINRITPYLERIVSEINETANVAQFTNNSVTYLHRVESSRNLQLRATPGDRLPLHCTALGKAIMSLLPEEKVDELLSGPKLQEFTESTSINVIKIKKELEVTRDRGYSIEVEEFEEGLICTAIPLNFEKYDFIGAVSFSGTTNRLNREGLLKIVERAIPIIKKMKKSLEK